MSKKKIALFGGTFDPIHLGHTKVADAAAKQIGAEQVVFIPAKCSALKNRPPQASDEDRAGMISLGIADYQNFRLNDCELQRPEPSFTLDTVRFLQGRFGSEASLYWLVGADTIDELPRWYRIAELIEECSLSVMCRAGYREPDFTKFEDVFGPSRLIKLQENIIKTPLIDISSTQVRKKVSAGSDVSDMLHPDVADYIREHNLYQPKPKPAR